MTGSERAFGIEERQAVPALAVRLRSTVEEIPRLVPPALEEAWHAAEALGLPPSGPPYARYLEDFPAAGGELSYEAGVTLPAPAPTGRGSAVPTDLPGGLVAVGWHVGPYDTLGRTYRALFAWIAEQGRTVAGPLWEVYWTDPDSAPPEEWRTEIVVPVA